MSWTLDPRYVPANVKWAKKAPTHLGDTIAALQGRPRDVSTLRPRPTTLSERIASAIVPDGRKWTDMRNKVSGAVDALTPLGAEQPLRDARTAYQGGNKWGAAGLGALAMLGAIPGVGTEAKAGTKAAKGIFGKKTLDQRGLLEQSGAVAADYVTPEALQPAQQLLYNQTMSGASTGNRIWDSAEHLKSALEQLGISPSISKSKNRNGDFSAYVDLGRERFRISDHQANADFRVSEIAAPEFSSQDDALGFAAKYLVGSREAAMRKQAEFDARNTLLEPYVQRFFNETDPAKQNEIIAEGLRAVGEVAPTSRVDRQSARMKWAADKWKRTAVVPYSQVDDGALAEILKKYGGR